MHIQPNMQEAWVGGPPSAAMAPTIAAPHLIWQATNGWPQFEVATVRGYVKVLARSTPPVPTRSSLRLSLAEREDISRGLAAGESLRMIAGRLGRAPSTVSREVRADGGRRRR